MTKIIAAYFAPYSTRATPPRDRVRRADDTWKKVRLNPTAEKAEEKI